MPVSYVLGSDSKGGYTQDLSQIVDGNGAMMKLAIIDDPDSHGQFEVAVPATDTDAGDYMAGSTVLAALQNVGESMGTGSLFVGDATQPGLIGFVDASGKSAGDLLRIASTLPDIALEWYTPNFQAAAITSGPNATAGQVAIDAAQTSVTVNTTGVVNTGGNTSLIQVTIAGFTGTADAALGAINVGNLVNGTSFDINIATIVPTASSVIVNWYIYGTAAAV